MNLESDAEIKNLSFEQLLVSRPYNRDEEKVRIECRTEPLIKKRLDVLFKMLYRINKTVSEVQGTRLGASILRDNPDIKEIEKIYKEMAYNADNFYFGLATKKNPYSFKNQSESRDKIKVYQWVFDYIYEINEPLGIHAYSLSLCMYLIGIQYAELIPEQHREPIITEVNDFYKYVKERRIFLEKLISKPEMGTGVQEYKGISVQGYKSTRTPTVGIDNNNTGGMGGEAISTKDSNCTHEEIDNIILKMNKEVR